MCLRMVSARPAVEHHCELAVHVPAQALSLDLQQRPVTAEPCAERRHPPVAAGRLFVERGLQHEVDARAADVAVVAQNRRAPSRVVFGQADTLPNGGENFPAAGVKNPSRDVCRATILSRSRPSVRT